MPIISCKDCKKKVSDSAGKCPQCGCPVVPLTANELKSLDEANRAATKGCLISMAIVVVIIVFIGMCSSEKKNEDPTPYEMIAVVFDGRPAKSEIQPMLESVVKYHGLDVDDNTLKQCINVLHTFKKRSVVGVSEMDILKHMYQNGSSSLEFYQQAAYSFTILEATR